MIQLWNFNAGRFTFWCCPGKSSEPPITIQGKFTCIVTPEHYIKDRRIQLWNIPISHYVTLSSVAWEKHKREDKIQSKVRYNPSLLNRSFWPARDDVNTYIKVSLRVGFFVHSINNVTCVLARSQMNTWQIMVDYRFHKDRWIVIKTQQSNSKQRLKCKT